MLDEVTTGMYLELGTYDVKEFYKQREGNWKGNFETTASHEITRIEFLMVLLLRMVLYVIVNGVIVVNDSQVLSDVSPRQPLRFPITE
jgi:hypothetical protein